jgi:hypothetical protein
MLVTELETLLANRKTALSEQKGSAIQRGDLDQLADIEAKLLEISKILDKLQGV